MSAGSVCARYTASGDAAKCRVTITWVSPSVCSVILLIFPLSYSDVRVSGVRGLSVLGGLGFGRVDCREKAIEPVVVFLQGLPQQVEPLVHGVNAVLGQPAGAARSIHPLKNQPSLLENLQVLRDGGLGQLERRGQFGHRGLAQGEMSKNRSSRGVGKGQKGDIEGVCFLHNYYLI